MIPGANVVRRRGRAVVLVFTFKSREAMVLLEDGRRKKFVVPTATASVRVNIAGHGSQMAEV